MDDKVNVTDLTLAGYVEVSKYRYLYFVLMFIAYILIICSNSLIICLIWIHRNLHEPMYIFIAALSVNSILFSTATHPKLLIDFYSDMQTISYPACLLQFLLFYSLGCSDYLLLAAMAYDRYVCICKPLHYPTIMRNTTVHIFLAVAWLFPAVQVAALVAVSAKKKLCVFTLAGIFCNNAMYKLHCVNSKVLSVFGVVILVNSAFLPVLFIFFTYLKILMVVIHSCAEARKKAADTCLPHLLVLISFLSLGTYDIIIARLESNLSKTVRFIMTLQLLLYNPLFNPIIYGLKIKEISKHIRKLFCRIDVSKC